MHHSHRRSIFQSPSTVRAIQRSGFTLIEVLVALSIVAVALLAGMRASSALVDNSGRLAQVYWAQLCANNQLIAMRLRGTMPDVGTSAFSCEQAGYKFDGEMNVSSTANPDVRRVDAIVKFDGYTLIKLSTLRATRWD